MSATWCIRFGDCAVIEEWEKLYTAVIYHELRPKRVTWMVEWRSIYHSTYAVLLALLNLRSMRDPARPKRRHNVYKILNSNAVYLGIMRHLTVTYATIVQSSYNLAQLVEQVAPWAVPALLIKPLVVQADARLSGTRCWCAGCSARAAEATFGEQAAAGRVSSKAHPLCGRGAVDRFLVQRTSHARRERRVRHASARTTGEWCLR